MQLLSIDFNIKYASFSHLRFVTVKHIMPLTSQVFIMIGHNLGIIYSTYYHNFIQ